MAIRPGTEQRRTARVMERALRRTIATDQQMSERSKRFEIIREGLFNLILFVAKDFQPYYSDVVGCTSPREDHTPKPGPSHLHWDRKDCPNYFPQLRKRGRK
jgi:hypothetical protein